MKVFCIILAGVCAVVAAVFVFRQDYDKAFVAAAAGVVCWVLNYRQQIKARVTSRAEENLEDEETDEEIRS